METILEDIQVMFIESPNGPAGSKEVFNKLESGLASIKGRKFYATFQHSTGLYRACVAIESTDNPQSLGFEVWSIPGGKYARQKLENWTERVDEIPTVFEKLYQEYEERFDSSRPSIEFYKSQKELILMFPIL